MKARKLDSVAVAAARVELAAIVRELRAIKTRALKLRRRLLHAAKAGEVVGVVDGKSFTVEECLAESVRGNVYDFEGDLVNAVSNFASLARDDYRAFALGIVKSSDKDLAAGKS